MADYYTTLTRKGTEKVAAAMSGGPALKPRTITVGDGGGSQFYSLYNQATLKERTSLVNQQWQGELNLVDVAPNNPALVVTEGLVPTHVGGWYIREVGIFDADGDMIAIGVYPETYKPVATAVEAELQIRSILEVGDAESVQLTIDPSQIMATREWVTETAIPDALTQERDTSLLGQSGWRRNTDDGFMVQWGTSEHVEGDANITLPFPKPFPNACWMVIPAIRNGVLGDDEVFARVIGYDNGTCTLRADVCSPDSSVSGTGRFIQFIAIGN